MGVSNYPILSKITKGNFPIVGNIFPFVKYLLN